MSDDTHDTQAPADPFAGPGPFWASPMTLISSGATSWFTRPDLRVGRHGHHGRRDTAA